MRRINVVCAAAAIMLISLPSRALAGEVEQRLYTIHPLVGDVIDAEENEKYNLFGPIEGFIAGKIYNILGLGETYSLHVIGLNNEGGYLIARELNIAKLREINEYLNDFESMSKETVSPSKNAPLIPLSKTALESIGRTLSIELIDDTELFGTIAHVAADTIFLKDLGLPILDSKIRKVKVVSSVPLLKSSEVPFPTRPITFSVSGISESAKAELAGTKHLRLWFGTESEGAIHLRRKPVTWTILADSLILTGPHDLEFPSKPLAQIDTGRSHALRGAGIGLLIGSMPSVLMLVKLNNDPIDDPGPEAAFALGAIVFGCPVIGGIIGAIVGSRSISWDRIYSSAP